MKAVVAVLATILGIILVVVLGIGIWQLGWFVEGKNVDKRAEITDKSYGRQTALIAQVEDQIVDIRTIDVQVNNVPAEQVPALKAQRAALVNQACQLASGITGTVTSAETAQFIALEC